MKHNLQLNGFVYSGELLPTAVYSIHTEQAVLWPAFNPAARYSRGNVMGEGTRFLKMNLLSDKDIMENQNKTNQWIYPKFS